MAAPQITYIMHDLYDAGLKVDTQAITIEEAKESILSVLGGNEIMMRDITIGQYYPADSILHRLDPKSEIYWNLFVLSVLICGGQLLGPMFWLLYF